MFFYSAAYRIYYKLKRNLNKYNQQQMIDLANLDAFLLLVIILSNINSIDSFPVFQTKDSNLGILTLIKLKK